MQARKQIEMLKSDLAYQQKALADTQAGRQRAKDLEQSLRKADLLTVLSDSAPMLVASSHGFADTQILP